MLLIFKFAFLFHISVTVSITLNLYTLIELQAERECFQQDTTKVSFVQETSVLNIPYSS